MGAAYSSGQVGGTGSGGAFSNQPSGGSNGGGGGGDVVGGGGRFPDGRSNTSSASGHPLLDHSAFPWLNLARGGHLPPSGSVNSPPMRAQPQLPPRPQQQPGTQSSIEELVANFSRANPNFLYSFLEYLRAQQQQPYQQTAPQSQIFTTQVSQATVSRSRSPVHHQQSPQTGVPRPSSGSQCGPGGQSTPGRPGSAISSPFNQIRLGGGNNKYGGSGNQSQQQTLTDQLGSTVAAVYPHRPSSSASASHRSSTSGPSSGYSALSTNFSQFHSAYAAAAAAASHLSHSENLQDLTRGGQSMGGGGGIPPSKRPRLVSSSASSALPPSVGPSFSPYLPQSTSLSRQHQQNELLNRQLLQNAANNRAALLALFTSAAHQQQQQQTTVSGSRAPSSTYYQPSDSYTQRNASQRQPGSQLLVSSPNTLSQSSAAATAAAAVAYGNLAAVAVAAAAHQQAASSAAVVAGNTSVYQQQAVAAACRSGYLHVPSSSTTSSRGSYQGQPQQTGIHGGSGGMAYHPHNTAHPAPSGSGVLRQQTKEPAYHPQVEAISPAPEEARLLDAVEVKLQREREEMQRRLHEIEARINKEESHLRYLKDRESSLTADLKNETVPPPPAHHRPKALSASEIEDERAYENPIQALLSETRLRAKKQHESFARLCGRSVSVSYCALPVYRQPSDLPALRYVQATYKNGFQRQLIKYIHRRKRAERVRLRILARHYSRHAQEFFKRHEKLMNSSKRKQKDLKNMEIFDKTFPEMKKIREDQGQNDGAKTDDGHDTGSNTGLNGADGDQMYDLVEDIAKMKEYAIDPPVTLAPWERSYHFLCTAHRIANPKSEHLKTQSLEKWSREEKARFKERFLATPKNFTAIAASLDKTVAECIHYYYLSKKSEGYKALVKKHSTSRRRRVGHSDKNGPTGPSHGTASKKSPSRVSTPSGDSPHPDLKNEDSHATGHRKGGAGGGSTRGRSGRRGDQRSTKGCGRGRSGTPVLIQAPTASSNALAQSDSVTADVKPVITENDKPQSSASKVDTKDSQAAPIKLMASGSTKTLNWSPFPMKESDEPKETTHSGSKQTSDPPSSDGRVPSAPSLMHCHKLIKLDVEKGMNANIQRGPEGVVSAGDGGAPTSSTDSRRGCAASPNNHATGIADSNLIHSSPASEAYSPPNPHPEESALNRPAFFDNCGSCSSFLPSIDAVAACNMAAGLPEQLANLAKNTVTAENISPELLASIPQLSAAVASGVTSFSVTPTQTLAQVFNQGMSRGGSSQSLIEKPSHDRSNQASDRGAAAYSKAILIGDFCTAQQLTSSQQAQLSVSANMTGTGLQNVADYTDPVYLSSRTIDPSTLPKKCNASGKSSPGPLRSKGHGNSQGILRSPPGTGGSIHNHQQPPIPPKSTRHRQLPSHLSSSIDAGVPRQASSRSLGIPQGGIYSPITSYGDNAAAKVGYYDLNPANPSVKNGAHLVNFDSSVSNRSSTGFDPKVEEYINHAAKLYHDEVERYTSRDRSDSMRTRTSSETSQQMHTALDNARQRVLNMAATAVTTDNRGSTKGYGNPSVFVDSISNGPVSGMLDINEMLAKYGPQYLSLIAAAAAEAPSSSTTAPISTSILTVEGNPLCTSKSSLVDSSPSPQPLQLSTSSAVASQFVSAPSLSIPQVMPLPRYRKSAGGSTAIVTTGHLPSSATSLGLSALSSQRDFFATAGEDNTPAGCFHSRFQQHYRYPTLMRASASRNLESMGLLPEEMASKGLTPSSRSQQHPSVAVSRSYSTTLQAPISASSNPSLVISSSFNSSCNPAAASFRSPECTNTSDTFTSSVTSSTAQVEPCTAFTGTLGDQIEKAIVDGIIVQQGDQDTPRIIPLTAVATSGKSIHSSSNLLKADPDNQNLLPLLISTARSSSAGVLASPTSLPMFPKKRNRLTSSGSVGLGPARLISPPRSCEAEVSTSQVSSTFTSPPNASPNSTEGRPSSSKSPSGACVNATILNASITSGISAISPPSSADSPGNLQICIPPEDEQSQYSPTPCEVAPGRLSGFSRQTSNSKSSNIGAALTASPSHILAANESVSPRRNPLPPSSSSLAEQQQQLQSP